MKFSAYPIQCEPILKERIWGGTKLKSLNKELSSDTTGESWELSTVPGDISRVANGIYNGKLLTELIEMFPEEILGVSIAKKFGAQLPLLFKFIDAREDLSIQVHPDDMLAKKRHNTFGKTEMWYIMQADADARLIVGFKQDASADLYLKHLKNNTLVDLLEEIPVSKGDAFLIEAGTVHAIGGGILLAEIQQTSDITYRIYDFDRKDADGNARELHVEQALEAINYEESDTQKVYERELNHSNAMVDSDYFTTNFIPLDGNLPVTKDESSFTVYMCTEGRFELRYGDDTLTYEMGDTVLVPAALQNYSLSGKASLLEIYIS